MSLRIIGKTLQAAGIAALMVGLVQGVYGDMWGELYLFLGGSTVFVTGRQLEKRWQERHQRNDASPAAPGGGTHTHHSL